MQACLPPMVPHFTDRQRECGDITGHAISKSSRIVPIWGSPGFGKTSVATAVGHQLQSKGLPVYFFSLRGLQSKTDLTSKMLSFFKRPSTNDQMPQRLSIDEELFQFLSEISEEVFLILDNADDLLESGAPKVKDDFINFLEDTLRRAENVTFAITTNFESNIVELLDNSDYPSNLRLKLLFESSFERLSAHEKGALVSLSILPEGFNLSAAAAVMGIKTILEAKKVLQRLRRKSLLDSSSRPDSFSMHKLLL